MTGPLPPQFIDFTSFISNFGSPTNVHIYDIYKRDFEHSSFQSSLSALEIMDWLCCQFPRLSLVGHYSRTYCSKTFFFTNRTHCSETFVFTSRTYSSITVVYTSRTHSPKTFVFACRRYCLNPLLFTGKTHSPITFVFKQFNKNTLTSFALLKLREYCYLKRMSRTFHR